MALVEAEVEAAVFVEALVLAAPLVAFFVPMRGFFLRVLSGWEEHALFQVCARVTRASLISGLAWSDINNV